MFPTHSITAKFKHLKTSKTVTGTQGNKDELFDFTAKFSGRG